MQVCPLFLLLLTLLYTGQFRAQLSDQETRRRCFETLNLFKSPNLFKAARKQFDEVWGTLDVFQSDFRGKFSSIWCGFLAALEWNGCWLG